MNAWVAIPLLSFISFSTLACRGAESGPVSQVEISDFEVASPDQPAHDILATGADTTVEIRQDAEKKLHLGQSSMCQELGKGRPDKDRGTSPNDKKCNADGVCQGGVCRFRPWSASVWWHEFGLFEPARVVDFPNLSRFKSVVFGPPGALMIGSVGRDSQNDKIVYPLELALMTLEPKLVAMAQYPTNTDANVGSDSNIAACAMPDGGFAIAYTVFFADTDDSTGLRLLRVGPDLALVFDTTIPATLSVEKDPQFTEWVRYIAPTSSGGIQLFTSSQRRLLINGKGAVESKQSVAKFGQILTLHQNALGTHALSLLGGSNGTNVDVEVTLLSGVDSQLLEPVGVALGVTTTSAPAWDGWSKRHASSPVVEFLGAISSDQRAVIAWLQSPNRPNPSHLKDGQLVFDKAIESYASGLVALSGDGKVAWRVDLNAIGGPLSTTPPVNPQLGASALTTELWHWPHFVAPSGSGWLIGMVSQRRYFDNHKEKYAYPVSWWLRLDASGAVSWSRFQPLKWQSLADLEMDSGQPLVRWISITTEFMLDAWSDFTPPMRRAITPWGAPLRPFQLNDAFGHRNAAESGVCSMLDADSCDDNNACTRDDCNAKLGCIHTPIPEGGSCTANGAVCKAGVCAK